MALVKTTLTNAIFNAFKSQQSKQQNPDDALKDLADKLATAFDDYIKSGTVNTTVTGSSVSGGPVTGSGTGTIS